MIWWNIFIAGKTTQQTIPSTPETCSLCTVKAFQRRVRMTPTTRHHNNSRCRWDTGMVQQLSNNAQIQWKVQLCLDPARLNQALIRLLYRGPLFNDILLKLHNAEYVCYRCDFWLSEPKTRQEITIPHNICMPVCRNRYNWLPFRIVTPGDMFKEK